MKLRKLLAMSAVIACGLTLASCGEKKVTVGVGYSGSFAESYGNMQLDLTAAMVSFEDDGTIVDARLDVVQVKVGLNEAGDGLALKNTNAVNGRVPTKLELGKDYSFTVSSGGKLICFAKSGGSMHRKVTYYPASSAASSCR